VLLVVLLVFVLDPWRRWALPRLLLTSLGAGLVVDVVKLSIARVRPHHFDFGGSVWATFGCWFPLGRDGSGLQSFPSGHTATAIGLAFVLAWLYPRGRWVFLALVLLVGVQRVVSGAHYLSDVIVGATIGCTTAFVCLHAGPLASFLDRWECSRRSICREGAASEK
jgi:membrane-associated phospholipid phosphatase